MPAPTPPLIPEAFAQSGDRATIPDATGAAGRASWSLGFPPVTMEAKIAGGIPPDGRDMNGALWAVSAHAFYAQAGQPFTYSTDISTAAGGYGLGAVIGSADGKTLWYNLFSGNTVDPDGAGTNWVSAFTYGSIAISGLTGGTRTLTRLESRFSQIVLTGLLVANQTIIMPNDIRDWRIINSTTGSFTVTVRTSGGSGVTVPQGGYTAAVGVYGNGTDINLDVQPVALPIAVTPDPDTLVKRDNVGDVFARYYNSSSSPESVSIANVMVTNGSDGYYRKLALSSFESQLTLSSVGGQVTNGQVPQSAVSQFFTGTNSANGHVQLPNGLIMQWGSVFVGNLPPQPGHATVVATFPIPFPNALFQVLTSIVDTNGGPGAPLPPYEVSSNVNGATFWMFEINAAVQNVTLRWFAIGN